LPINSSALTSIARFFKPDPYRDLFRVLADTLDDAVLVISSDSFQILTCNHAFLLLSGYARTEIEKLTFADLLTDEEEGKAVLSQLIPCSKTPDCIIEEVPIRTRNKEITPIDIHVRPVGLGSSALLLIGSPVSDRIHVEDQRLAQQERLDTLSQISTLILDEMVAALPSALDLAKRLLCASWIGLYRLSASTPDYILDGSLPPEFPQALPASDIIPFHTTSLWYLGQRPEFTLHKSARAAGFGALQTSLVGDLTAWVGLLVVGWQNQDAIPDYSDLLMSVIANLCHVAILLSLQRASVADGEKALEQLQAEVSDQFAAIPDILLSLDSDLNVIQANPAITKLFGYQPEEVAGLPIQDVLVSSKDIRPILLDAVNHKQIAELERVVLHHRDGTPLPVHMLATPLSDQAQSRLLIILKDQSAQQEIEDQTETLTQHAQLGEVIATFAHEVRNPINNISTGVQLVASRLGEDHSLHSSLERVHKECNRLDQLMSDVLSYARPLKLKIKQINLTEFMERILSRWTPHFKQAGISCHKSYNPDTPFALADEPTLERVIVNLITNSIQAMPDGGTLSIALDSTHTAQGEMVELKIIDTGPGISPDVKDRIFDPFFTTKKDGTGLGLAISHRILNAHKGTINFESFTDAGTVFTICLPSVTHSSEEATHDRDRPDR